MKKKIIISPIVLMLCCLAVNCHKEAIPPTDTSRIQTDIQVLYLIDGKLHIAHPQDSTQRHLLLADLVALAHHHHIRILPGTPFAVTTDSKETKTFETKDPDEAIKWINEMKKLGYTTDITFDETTGLYILIATK